MNNTDNSADELRGSAELNLFVRLSNYTVALVLQYNDKDLVVAHFSTTQSAWNLHHSKKSLLELGNFLLAWRHLPQMLTHHSLPQTLPPTMVATTSLRTVLADNRRWYHKVCFNLIKDPNALQFVRRADNFVKFLRK